MCLFFFSQLIKHLSKPLDSWGPYLKEHRAQRQMMGDGYNQESQIPLKEQGDGQKV